jgi:cyclophilin family peptidyl-prolyl cis-trans isomerase
MKLTVQIQGGDPTGTGRGGKSFWGEPFRDEHGEKGAYKHDARGVLVSLLVLAITMSKAETLVYGKQRSQDERLSVLLHLLPLDPPRW